MRWGESHSLKEVTHRVVWARLPGRGKYEHTCYTLLTLTLSDMAVRKREKTVT